MTFRDLVSILYYCRSMHRAGIDQSPPTVQTDQNPRQTDPLLNHSRPIYRAQPQTTRPPAMRPAQEMVPSSLIPSNSTQPLLTSLVRPMQQFRPHNPNQITLLPRTPQLPNMPPYQMNPKSSSAQRPTANPVFLNQPMNTTTQPQSQPVISQQQTMQPPFISQQTDLTQQLQATHLSQQLQPPQPIHQHSQQINNLHRGFNEQVVESIPDAFQRPNLYSNPEMLNTFQQLPIQPTQHVSINLLGYFFTSDTYHRYPSDAERISHTNVAGLIPYTASASQHPSSSCDSRFKRCTLQQIPATQALLLKSKLPFGLILAPFKQEDSVTEVPIINPEQIVRCRRCRYYPTLPCLIYFVILFFLLSSLIFFFFFTLLILILLLLLLLI
jgi:hypothetical protein